LAMSVDLLLEFTGLASLGQAAYLGVYLTAILATKYQFGLGWNLWLVIVFGILIGAAKVALFGLTARHRALNAPTPIEISSGPPTAMEIASLMWCTMPGPLCR
jgi:ABC-type branched-subunit amino acid transport system permease subunit